MSDETKPFAEFKDIAGYRHIEIGGIVFPAGGYTEGGIRQDAETLNRAVQARERQACVERDAEITRLRGERDAAHQIIEAKVGVNRCMCCGTAVEFDRGGLSRWRSCGGRDGTWQHACPQNHPQAGYFAATFVPGTLSRDHAEHERAAATRALREAAKAACCLTLAGGGYAASTWLEKRADITERGEVAP